MSSFRGSSTSVNNSTFRGNGGSRWNGRGGGPPSTPTRNSYNNNNTLRPQHNNSQDDSRKSTSPTGPKTLNGILLPTKIFVGGIGPRTGDEEVRHLFATEGEVLTVRIVTDRSIGLKNGEPRRYAFVEFASEDVVQKVLEKFGKVDLMLDERRLNIGPAFKKPQTFNLTFAPSSPVRDENGPSRNQIGGPARTSPPVSQNHQQQSTSGYQTTAQSLAAQNQQMYQQFAQNGYYYPYPYGYQAYNPGAGYYNGAMNYMQFPSGAYGGYPSYSMPQQQQVSPTFGGQGNNGSVNGGSPNGSPTGSLRGAGLGGNSALMRNGSTDYSDGENQQPANNGGLNMGGYGNGGYVNMPMGMMAGNGYQNSYQAPASNYNNSVPRYNQQPIYAQCNPYGAYAQTSAMQPQTGDYYSAY